ncbi:NDR1/HIN1-like protein 3 [Macadamia integrifolia]|uniref:NDR1/HIN1-like protein 3 n=1 Tax=Macadamia integrifolia TaxID=60698 RepID=UPI001C52A0D3|nr:NDR1/HIN1-like protein 3 [Macadamia integrifolia]
MAEAKQPHLNGAYYGPPIPPQTYHRPGRGPGLCCCGCCLLNCLLKIIFSIVLVLGIIVLVFWLVLRPNKIKFYVVDASLTEFNLTGNTLSYDLALNMTIRNPNKKIGVYYDRIEARAYYDDIMFGSTTLSPFYQGHKNTSMLSPSFKGDSQMSLDSQALSEYKTETSSGEYYVDVKLYLRVRFKIGKVKTSHMKPKVKCDLKVPLVSNRNSAGGFDTTKCHLDF